MNILIRVMRGLKKMKKEESIMSILNKRSNLMVIGLLLMFGVYGLAQAEAQQSNQKPTSQHNSQKQNIQSHHLAQTIIVKFKNPTPSTSLASSRMVTLSQQLNVDFRFKRMMSGDAEVWYLNDYSRSSYNDLHAVIEALNQNSDVEYAEVDALMVAYRTPNDTLYNQQWHYENTVGGMRLPGAWNISTGSMAVTVAVLDTGYRPHADLVGNIINEYDMISDAFVGNDGNARDGNARDPGDWITVNECGYMHGSKDSTWHGTHVAGTVAAMSNNGNGVAGVAWNVNLVPVRVLGKCGGYVSDIADAIRWAAGLTVTGVPANTTPADVINMSLGAGSPGACEVSYQNAINAAYNAGTTIVVAAGNANDSWGYSPGNCNNTITVAAGANDGARAYYSNYGPTVDITAPGGDGCNPINNNYPADTSKCQGGVWDETRMVLSTHNSGTTVPGANSYGWQQGTSMAAPHVAGLAALIKSVNGSLTPAEVKQIIQDSADTFATVPDHQCDTTICGAGYANATVALQMTLATTGPDNIFSNGFESDIIFKDGFD